MERGEIWRYEAKGPRGPRHVIIVSGSGINMDGRRSWLLGVDVLPEDPGDLLAVPVPGGWADASSLVRIYRRWLISQADSLDTEARERLDVALRAALDL